MAKLIKVKSSETLLIWRCLNEKCSTFGDNIYREIPSTNSKMEDECPACHKRMQCTFVLAHVEED